MPKKIKKKNAEDRRADMENLDGVVEDVSMAELADGERLDRKNVEDRERLTATSDALSVGDPDAGDVGISGGLAAVGLERDAAPVDLEADGILDVDGFGSVLPEAQDVIEEEDEEAEVDGLDEDEGDDAADDDEEDESKKESGEVEKGPGSRKGRHARTRTKMN